jgi:predicted DNA-binding protein with PD1-like motif
VGVKSWAKTIETQDPVVVEEAEDAAEEAAKEKVEAAQVSLLWCLANKEIWCWLEKEKEWVKKQKQRQRL